MWRRTYGGAVARIHYEIPDDLHRRAKSSAALLGLTLKQFIERALNEAVTAAESKNTETD